MICVWTTSTSCYYLLTYQLKYIEGNIYFNNIVSGTADIFAFLLSGSVFKTIGFKRTMLFSFFLSFLGMLFLLVLHPSSSNQSTLALLILISKFGIVQAQALAFIGNQHLFPAPVLATTFATCNFFTRMATIFAPYVAEIKPEEVAMWTFLGMVLVTSGATFFIKEPQEKTDEA